jgi:CheY-like chemotaxis protein
MRILVVDDNRDAAESLRMLLSLYGHDVQAFCDAPSALAAAKDRLFDVVLFDLAMPKMDGHELSRRLRQTPGTEKALLVCVTGVQGEAAERASREAGCNYHLLKPVATEELLRVLALKK